MKELTTFAEQMAGPYLADVEPNDGPFAPPREVEPVTEALWAAVEARLRAERIAAGDCPECGDDAEPVMACGCSTWVHQMDAGHVHCTHHGDVTLHCADCGAVREEPAR